jgi:hypothetical protein
VSKIRNRGQQQVDRMSRTIDRADAQLMSMPAASDAPPETQMSIDPSQAEEDAQRGLVREGNHRKGGNSDPEDVANSALNVIGDATNAGSLIDQVARGNAGQQLAGLGALTAACDALNNGLNVANGVDFVVNVADIAAGANVFVRAFSTGYTIGQLIDSLTGISDRLGGLAGQDVAGGDAALLQMIERLAAQGDRQCQRLQELLVMRAQYEDVGSQQVPGLRGHPELARERGRVHVQADVQASLPTDSDLARQIENEIEILEDRVTEARRLVRQLDRRAGRLSADTSNGHQPTRNH